MNNINPIFEALSNVDDRHIPVETKKRPHTKLKIALIAAAAAAVLSLIVGAAMPRSKSYGKLDIFYGNTEDDVVYLYPTPQKFIVPEGLEFVDGVGGGQLETLDEVREILGVTPILNDNFVISGMDSEYPRHIGYSVWNYPDTNITNALMIDYYPFSKSLNKDIYITTIYNTDVDFMEDRPNPNHKYEDVEILTLNDGSQCVLKDHRATFVYDGVSYSVQSDNQEQLSNDEIKQVLSDLGVYDLNE